MKNREQILNKVLILLFSICFVSVSSQNLLDSLLQSDLQKYSSVLNNPSKYKLQIFYTKIDRDQNNRPDFKDYKVAGNGTYFYPASTVKLPVSLLALIKLEELNITGVNRSTAMIDDSLNACSRKALTDASSESGLPTIENYIRKMFLVSDNQACARVYDFVGYEYAHKKLNELGYPRVRLFNKLDGLCTEDSVISTPPLYFLGGNKDTLYKQPSFSALNKMQHPLADSKVGKTQKDFSRHNYLELSDLHSMMKRLVFNASLKDPLPISEENRLFMLKYLGMYPKESNYPKYDPKTYYDSWKKYFIYGSSVATVSGDSIRVINIVGRAYGFLVDCAYIVDFKNKVEYLLTAGLYVNERNTFSTGRYEYDNTGLPFLKQLSLSIYNYERNRRKKYSPDLTEIQALFKN